MKYAKHHIGINKFGATLKKIRLEKGISQEQLANDCNVEVSQISRIERGVINTSISMAYIISDAMNIKVKDLFTE